jgi:hypothetical protein
VSWLLEHRCLNFPTLQLCIEADLITKKRVLMLYSGRSCRIVVCLRHSLVKLLSWMLTLPVVHSARSPVQTPGGPDAIKQLICFCCSGVTVLQADPIAWHFPSSTGRCRIWQHPMFMAAVTAIVGRHLDVRRGLHFT